MPPNLIALKLFRPATHSDSCHSNDPPSSRINSLYPGGMPKGKNSTKGTQRPIDFFPNPDIKEIQNCAGTQSPVGTDLPATAEAPTDPMSPVKDLLCQCKPSTAKNL